LCPEERRSGRQVPDEVDQRHYFTTMHYPIKELVEKAMGLLISQINSAEVPSETIVLEPSMTVRRSTMKYPLVESSPGRP
jgi:DNA-binding LacI/PurR family transcriptional regulator